MQNSKNGSSMQQSTGIPLTLDFSNPPKTCHALFYCEAVRLAFEEADLDVSLLSQSQPLLLDALQYYLLNGGDIDFSVALKDFCSSEDLEVLLTTLKGYRLIIKEGRFKKLSELDRYLEAWNEQLLNDVLKRYTVD
ncbi:MAG: hypothetical protein AAF849_19820 [Bacteroidota bacterium]